eukprot:TRINITY_DN25184_c0_g1_i1.p1 TRINITY_DN25184_c0_g1~~TRINITY_DN25184_c0_g1_i1.p1  ORF type:complete len:100 (+),score=1.78 TRINITY_DN25184_c0_g1_i1:922-1221(+)
MREVVKIYFMVGGDAWVESTMSKTFLPRFFCENKQPNYDSYKQKQLCAEFEKQRHYQRRLCYQHASPPAKPAKHTGLTCGRRRAANAAGSRAVASSVQA